MYCSTQAQAAEDEPLEQVVVTGTRVANRSALDTAVPVDVVSAEQLSNVGVAEVSQALAASLPSFNFPRPGLADGTDSIRPATLRGLAPDQTLVLVNGKRRHAASLVNANGTVGRGSSAVDLNTIPAGALQSIEVLRDGASAQYGSDAIAGVLNLRLREAHEGGDATISYGWRESSYDTPTAAPDDRFPGAVLTPTWSAPPILQRDVSDGETLVASLWKGLSLGESGFVTLAAEYKDQEHTERGGWDQRRQYPLLPGNVFDPREATFDRFNSWYGEPELEQKTLFVNAGYDFASGAHMYGWASWQDRDVSAPGFYRLADDPSNRNVLEIYPDGFLPFISPEVTDYSAAYGVRWKLSDWDMDSSLVYGKNKMEFTIENTLNRSLGVNSPTVFDAGGFDYEQLVLNLSGVRSVAMSAFSSPLNVAIGIEARQEEYSIFAGEPDSYRNGGVLFNGAPTASGSQVFAGFRPANAGSEDRTAVGAYLDLEANVTEQFLASVALRGEHYSDFGESLSGKVAGRYDFTDSFALRASVQTGFRAPSLQQQFFQTTSTNFIGGLPFDVTTFPATDPIAQAMGAQELDAEESIGFSVGAVLRLGEVDITIDAYRIDIDDRIVLSENLTSRGSAHLPDEPGLHRRRRRPLLHQRRRHGNTRRRPGRELAGRKRRRPLRLHLHRELQRDRGDARAEHAAARGVEPAARAVRSLQHPHVRGRHAEGQAQRAGRLEPRPPGRDAARDSLRRSVLARQCRDVCNGGCRNGSGRHRARRQDARGSGRPLRPDRQHPAGDRRGESVRRVSGPEHAARQPDRHDLVLELLALRALGTVRLRQGELQVLS